MTLTDTLNRPLRDLRISVTDRCNFRCVYCMPKEIYGKGYQFLQKDQLLTLEELGLRAPAAGVFKCLNGGAVPVARVQGGIDAPAAAGPAPAKIHMLARRGLNEQSPLPMARYFREKALILRFIEYMDVGHTTGWRLE